MARAAYKMLKDEAASATEKKVLATALNAVLGNTADQEAPQSQPKSAKPRASASPNRMHSGTGTPHEIRAKGTEIARKSSTAAAKPAPKPVDTRFDQIRGLNAAVVQALPTLNPSRTFEEHKRTDIAGRLFGAWVGPNAETWTLAIAPDERSFLHACSSGLFKWDIETARILIDFEGQKAKDTFGCDISSDGRICASISYGPDRVDCWDYQTGKKISELPLSSGYDKGLRFIPHSSSLVCTDGGRFVFWDTSTGSHEFVQTSYGYENISISSDGAKLFALSNKGHIETWDVQSRRKLSETEAPQYGRHHAVIAVSPDWPLAITTPGNTWWDLSTGKTITTHDHIQGLANPDRGAAMSKDGRWAITAFMEHAILWDMKELKPAKKIGGFKEIRTHYFTFSPSSDFVIGSAGSKSTYLWRL